ncbi:MAG: biotin/lipoyl-binding protein [Flavobacteriaceae bacterium]|nr:biotin/lipoyl-binding protein [Flavobacteriaceae bacterium]
MSQKFKVKVNDSFHFDLDQEAIQNFNSIQESENAFHILEKSKSYKAKLIHANFNKRNYKVEVNGNSYHVSISGTLDIMIDKLGLAASTTKKANDIKAPMPGLIVTVGVEEGQEIKEGDNVVVLEAMKMENTLVSPGEGTVQSVLVRAGDKVDKNQLLIEII